MSSARLAAAVVQRGQAYAGFQFKMVQADNGPEYTSEFEHVLRANGYTWDYSAKHRLTCCKGLELITIWLLAASG
jgi:hypothetical protein